jgi:hypothetical protein
MGLRLVPIHGTKLSIDSLLVIFLDKADAFLEQRRMFGMERNSVVSGQTAIIVTASLPD